ETRAGRRFGRSHLCRRPWLQLDALRCTQCRPRDGWRYRLHHRRPVRRTQQHLRQQHAGRTRHRRAEGPAVGDRRHPPGRRRRAPRLLRRPAAGPLHLVTNTNGSMTLNDSNDAPELETGLDTVSPEPAKAAAAPGKPKDITRLKVEKSCSRGLAGWLAGNRMSLAISSYQTGRVYLVGSDKQGRVSFFERIFERAMGIVGNAQRIYLGGLYQLWRFENALRPNEVIHGQFDK